MQTILFIVATVARVKALCIILFSCQRFVDNDECFALFFCCIGRRSAPTRSPAQEAYSSSGVSVFTRGYLSQCLESFVQERRRQHTTPAPVTPRLAYHATAKVQKHAVQNLDHDDEVNEVFAPACLFSCVVLFHIS